MVEQEKAFKERDHLLSPLDFRCYAMIGYFFEKDQKKNWKF